MTITIDTKDLRPTTLAALYVDMPVGYGYAASKMYEQLCALVGNDEANDMIDKEQKIQ